MRRPLQLVIFLTVVSTLLFLVGTIIYHAVALAFAVPSGWLIYLAGALVVLSASFIIATILGNFYYNYFTRVYYTLSAIWMGSFLYLFFASLLYGLLTVALPAPHIVGQTLLGLAFLTSFHAVLHARRIIFTHVPLTLPHLPSSWVGRRVAWISDVHLGQLHGVPFAQRVIKAVMSLSPDIVFVGGDLFDGTGAPDIPELVAPFKNLIAPLGVYYVTGNHEEYGDRERFIKAVDAVGMHVLFDEMVVVDGVQLIGVDYREASDTTRFANILKGLHIDHSKPSILLKHEPKDVAVANAAGVSLMISGHTHKAQLWPLKYIAELSYKGFVYGLNRFGKTQVFTSSGVGTWGPPMRVGTNSEVVCFTLGNGE